MTEDKDKCYVLTVPLKHKNRIVIPKSIVDALGLELNDLVEISIKKKE